MTFVFLVALAATTAFAQTAPTIGYVYPPSAQPGTTIDVMLGGYDWTPDLQVFVHDERIKIEILGAPSEAIVAPPPYWFGGKARGAAFPMPREIPARITIPADVPVAPMRWQVANANGASSSGTFYVGTQREAVESRHRDQPQLLAELPVTVCGRLAKIEEVDRYQIKATKTGPVSCELFARRLGTPMNGILQVHDAKGRLLADVADTTGVDTALTFAAEAGTEYTLSVFDLDFRGDRAYVYRLEITAGPRVVAVLPAAGRRGETRPVEFLGYGVMTGSAKLEAVTRDVHFPDHPHADNFNYRLETPFGTTAPFRYPLSDLPESVESSDQPVVASPHAVPFAVTGRLAEATHEDRFSLEGHKGENWLISVCGCDSECLLYPIVAVFSTDGKELARNESSDNGRNAGIQFTLPADGSYQVAVSSLSAGTSATSAIYRLVVDAPKPDFRLSCSELLNLPIGTPKTELTITAKRLGGFVEPISLEFSGLPDGVATSGDLTIPAGQNELKVALSSAADAPADASLVRIRGTAKFGDATITRKAGPLLVAQTMKPRAKVTPVDKDGGRTVHRGTTFPAPVLIERLEGYEGDVMLEMSSAQDRHRQGIRGPEIAVPAGVGRIDYPCFMPEWLETSRTSRMILNAVTKVPDPRGRTRYLLNRMDGRITMSMEGALLKISYRASELRVHAGETFEIPVGISRSPKLQEPVRIELKTDAEFAGLITVEPVDLPVDKNEAVLQVTSKADFRLEGVIPVTLRATASPQPQLPVVSEALMEIEFAAKE